MTITLNHTIVPSHDKVESARFYSRVFGFDYIGEFHHFIVVKVNDTLSLDFDNRENSNLITMRLKFPSRNSTKYSNA